MVITLNYDSNAINKNKNVHYMPCGIKKDGYANVSAYMNKEETQNKVLTTSFRGRPLSGVSIKLPEGYSGCVIEKTENDGSAVIKETFDQFTYWNLDVTPSKNDKLISAFEWIEISKSIHSYEDELCSNDETS